MSVVSQDAPLELRAPDAEVRRQAVARLAEREGTCVTRWLMRSLGDDDWRVRQEAVGVLSRRALKHAELDALVSLLADGDVASRNGAVVVLGAQGQPALAAIEAAWAALNADARKLAVEAAARTGLVDLIERLQPLLDDPDENVRMAVVEAIASVGLAAPHLARPLLERCLGCGDEFFERAVLESLVQLDWAPGWESLERLLVQPVFRDVALRVAASTGAAPAARHFVEHLQRAQGRSWNEGLCVFARYVLGSAVALRAAREAIRQADVALGKRLWSTLQSDSAASEVQASALVLLAASGDGRVAERAVSALADEALAHAAWQALMMLDRQATSSIHAALQSDDEAVVVGCVGLLVELASRDGGGDDLASLLRPLCEHRAPNVVRAWLEAVAAVGDEGDCSRIQRCWVDASSAAVRLSAAEAWTAWARRFPEAARAAAQGVLPEQAAAGVVALTIAALQQPVFGDRASDLRFLCETASSEHRGARAAAIQALAAFDAPAALDVVEFALRDEEADVRMAAVRSLGQMRDGQGQPVGASSLLELIETTADPMLGTAALEALSQADERWVAEQLTRVIRASTEAWRAVGAVEALCHLSVDSRESGLRAAFEHAQADVVQAALAAIAGQESHFEVELLGCVQHEAREVRRAAIEQVTRLGATVARRVLEERVRLETEPLVLEAIAQRLTWLEVEARGDGGRGAPEVEGQTH